MEKPVKQNRVNGWLVIDKPIGLTSYAVVAAIKKILKVKKVGHAGTLDPQATGILSVAVGEATKTICYQADAKKTYSFKVIWGAQTDTDDADGQIINQSTSRPKQSDLLDILSSFSGPLKQIPPKFSAKKIKGKRAYKLARQSETFNLSPVSIEIFNIELINSSPDFANFIVTCSKGTYVRAIARDMGLALSCYGHATSIRRIKVGSLDLSSSIKFDQVISLSSSELMNIMLPTEIVLANVIEIKCTKNEFQKVINGQAIKIESLINNQKAWASFQGSPIALGVSNDNLFIPNRILKIDPQINSSNDNREKI